MTVERKGKDNAKGSVMNDLCLNSAGIVIHSVRVNDPLIAICHANGVPWEVLGSAYTVKRVILIH
jgi:hypothetical protein